MKTSMFDARDNLHPVAKRLFVTACDGLEFGYCWFAAADRISTTILRGLL